MTILTDAQAANFLRTPITDAVMLQLMPLVDEYLRNATGHDWASDATIDKTAITAAGMLLTHWYDNPSLVGQAPAALAATLSQLEAKALDYRMYEFSGASGAGAVSLPGIRKGDVVQKLVGVYGVSGSQTSKFESIVSVAGQLQQIEAADLSDNRYVVVVKNPADEVSA